MNGLSMNGQKLFTAAQMRALEQGEIAGGRVTGLELMERAGAGVVQAMLDEWPDLESGHGRAVVLCGPGNNGGDGFVIARLLQARGWEVLACLYGDGARLAADAQVMQTRWHGSGETVALTVPVEAAVSRRLHAFAGPDVPGRTLVIIDALFGTGLRRPLGGAAQGRAAQGDGLAMLGVHLGASMGGRLGELRREDGVGIRCVAVDVPSGLCADSGRILVDAGAGLSDDDIEADPRCAAIMADLTVTFHAAKPGHMIGMGPRLCGRLRVVDIGLPHDGGVRPGDVALVGPPRAEWLGKQRGQKFDHGHAVIMSGGHGRAGAARLAARAALRVGAGLVTVASPPDAMAETAARLDAVMLRAVAGAKALEAMLEDGRIRALCLGPALGTGVAEAECLAVALRWAATGEGRSLVLDADALTLLARDAALFAMLGETCILTPHEGEFARLFGDLAGRLRLPAAVGPAFSKVDAAREAAARAGCTVLLKGPDTVIASGRDAVAVHAAAYGRAAPWLATAGSGDVLAGIITGLAARWRDPFEAACGGAWLHTEAARAFGPGLIAEDLPEALPAVLRQLGV